MTASLLGIGNSIRDAYASSVGEGHASWLGYCAQGMQVYHVPALPGDGTPIDPPRIGAGASAETKALEAIRCRIGVEAVRQAGDDTLILETVFTGTLSSGDDFRYDNTLIYTFRDDKIVRLIEVGSEDMWTTLAKELHDTTGYSGAANRT
jgi:ketosteroid isomerase-like protein